MWGLLVLLTVLVCSLLRTRLRIEFAFNPALSVKGRVLMFSFPLYPYSEKKRKRESPKKPKDSPNRISASVKEAVSLKNLLHKKPRSLTLSLSCFHLFVGGKDAFDTFRLYSLLYQVSQALFYALSCMFPHFSVNNVSVTPHFLSQGFDGEVRGEISLSVYDFLKLVLRRYKHKIPQKEEQR